jgi:hypothetical protein
MKPGPVQPSTAVGQASAISYSGIERRKNVRLEARLKAMRSSQAGFFIEDQIFNISRSGFQLSTLEYLKVGDRLEIFLQNPNGGGDLTIQADVVHVKIGSEYQIPSSRGPSMANVKALEEDEEDEIIGLPIQEGGNKEDLTSMDPNQTIQAGLYLSFVEPSQKKVLQTFIEKNILTPISQPRIRLELDGPGNSEQIQSLQNLKDRGLFIEVAYPLSIFDLPWIRLVNPLSQEVHDLSGEIVHSQVMNRKRAAPKNPSRYGIRVRFGDLSVSDRQAIENLIATIAPNARTLHSGSGKIPSC